ncbi:MAG: phosphoribosyltransferase [Candidatus Saccharibacteria bacterium]|nr:phosphoribosyltransferase [Candidatus Saccharibacteria bacterium]
MLASLIAQKYHGQRCAVVALGDGGAMVGAQIAQELHCALTLLVTGEITLPRENDPIAGITQGGAMSYNHRYSQGEIDEQLSEYYSFVEQEKLLQMHQMNALITGDGTIDKRLLTDHNIILVSDGLRSGFPIDLAYEFLKPIALKKLIVAAPFASVQAVDRMHVLADDLYCLSVIEDYIDTDHYYDTQDVPNHDVVLKTIEHLVHDWK